MFTHRRLPLVMTFAAVAGVLAACGGALAQSPRGDETADPALKGPAIDAPPSAKKNASGFGPDAVAKKSAPGKHATPLAMVDFMKSVDLLRAAPTPEATRLTAEEDARIRTIVSDLENSTKSYMDAHKQELDTLRGKLSATDLNLLDQQLARGGPIRLSKAGFGGKGAVAKAKNKGNASSSADGGAATTPSKDDAAKTRTQLVEIYAGRPKAEDAQAKILGVLTPDQLTLVNEALAKHDDAGKAKKHARAARAKKA